MKLTRDKFGEAEYFLERMKETTGGGAAFRYNLSAFLATGRSITSVLQTEYGDNDQHGDIFGEWYGTASGDDDLEPGTKQYEMRQDELLKFILKKRNYVIHSGPPTGVTVLELRNPGDISQPVEIGLEDDFSETVHTIGGGTTTVQYPPQPEKIPTPVVQELDIDTEHGFDVDAEHRYYFTDIPKMDLPESCGDVPITEVAENYLEKIDSLVLSEWAQYFDGEITQDDLLG